jgi:lipopolysaccharide transport system ATP-binding protein
MNYRDIAIKTENISKYYRIGLNENVHDSIGNAILDLIASPLKNYRKYRSLYKFDDINPGQDYADIIWALRDVSFEVKQGEVVGIIGRNGAGKSTLLKILCRITDPTSGRAEIRGRVSSLLEVGTGFHPELTGRENIYLNGTILGMRKKEVDLKFDEIVDFSGVEKFINTPVKRYSSGMKVRLAFAVAAHLEPEILLIDEVLAVGDARFQKKCLNKMEDVGQQGRTVLFVSHNMPAITRLCPRTILLDSGGMLADGPSPEVVGAYLNTGLGTTAAREWPDLAKAPGDDVVRLCAVRVRTEEGQTTNAVDIRRPVGIEMEYEVLQPGRILLPYFILLNEEGVRVLSSIDQAPVWRGRPRPPGRYTSTGWIPGNLLAEGTPFVSLAMKAPDPKISHFREREAVAFQVIDSLDGDSARGDFAGRISALVRPLLRWETQFDPNGSKALCGDDD